MKEKVWGIVWEPLPWGRKWSDRKDIFSEKCTVLERCIEIIVTDIFLCCWIWNKMSTLPVLLQPLFCIYKLVLKELKSIKLWPVILEVRKAIVLGGNREWQEMVQGVSQVLFWPFSGSSSKEYVKTLSCIAAVHVFSLCMRVFHEMLLKSKTPFYFGTHILIIYMV